MFDLENFKYNIVSIAVFNEKILKTKKMKNGEQITTNRLQGAIDGAVTPLIEKK